MIPMNSERQAPAGIPQGITVRSAIEFLPSTLRDSDRSVEFVLATETPARVWDWERWDIIIEVLRSDGIELPKNNQVSLIDSHDTRSSVKKVLGSVREIRKENDIIVGRLYFARDAQSEFDKVKDGHITSGSVGYNPQQRQWINEGESYNYNGRNYDGPMMLTKTWRLGEYSLVAIPADENAVARTEVNNSRKAELIQEGTTMEPTTPTPPANHEAEELKRQLVAEKAKNEAAEKARQEAITRAERAETDNLIRTTYARFPGTKELAEKMIVEKADAKRMQEELLDFLSRGTTAITGAKVPTVQGGLDDKDKFRAAVTDGLLLSVAQHAGAPDKPADGADEFRSRRLVDIAERCLQKDGVNTRNMTPQQISEFALGLRSCVGIDGTTGSFPYILESIATKSVMKGFEEARKFWPGVCAIGSVPDFKTVSYIDMSEAANLRLKREGGEYYIGKFNEKKATGAVGTYALGYKMTREGIINDDKSMFSRIPFKHGAAAARVPETLLFTILNDNIALFSGGNLFDTSYNDTIAAGGMTPTTIAAAISKMLTQKGYGEDEAPTDDVQPTTFLVHPNKSFQARIYLESESEVAPAMSSGVKNPLRDENLVSRRSSRITNENHQFLFADPNIVDMFEMLFLNGRQVPEMMLKEHPTIDGSIYLVRFDVGLAVLGRRGIARMRTA